MENKEKKQMLTTELTKEKGGGIVGIIQDITINGIKLHLAQNGTGGKVIFDESTAAASLKYGTFIMGDNPYTVIENPALTDGSACIVVKESFGNAFVPFLTDHYQTIYVLDYRYWKGSISQFAQDKGVQDVLFVNNLSAIRGSYQMGKLAGVK
mgnify:CR=1 FL=1